MEVMGVYEKQPSRIELSCWALAQTQGPNTMNDEGVDTHV